MDYLITIIYPVLVFLLFYKGKFFGAGKYNEDYLSRDSMKALQGFAAILIMLHHVSQKTCAYGIPQEYLRHGLEPFINMGFLLVALFFFCSGYGLTISEMNNVNYMDDFLKKRVVPLIIPFALSNVIFLRLEASKGIDSNFGFFANTYSWFVVVIFIVYIFFWLIYRTYIKDSIKLILMTVSIVAFMVISYNLGNGEWWINSLPSFVVGMIYAKNNTKITAFIRKKYPLWVTLFAILFSSAFFLSNYVYKEFWGVDLYTFPIIKVVLQMICSTMFVLLIFTIGMKVRIGNPVLNFLGKYTLELYLFHVVFVEIFAYCFIFPFCKPYFYISNNLLYLLAVIAITIPVAIAVHYANGFIVKLVYKINVDIFEFQGPYYRRIIAAVLIIAVLLTIGNAFTNSRDVKSSKEAYDKYILENDIKIIDVGNGNNVAASIKGEGDTIVLLDFSDFTSPILYMKKLAKDLSANYRVVTLETPGFGFAGKANTKQDVNTIVEEIHVALTSLGITENYALFARNEGAFVADSYLETYQNEVSEIITLDGTLVEQYEGIIDATNGYWDGYWNGMYSSLKVRFLGLSSIKGTGYISWFWESFKRYLQSLYFDESEVEAMHYIYVNQFYSGGYFSFYKELPFYCGDNMNHMYSEDMKVTMIVSGYMSDVLRRNYDMDWEVVHSAPISNPDNQSVIYMYGTSDAPMTKHKELSELIMEIL